MTVRGLSTDMRSAQSRATWSRATWSQATCTDGGPGRPQAQQAAAGAELTTTLSLGPGLRARPSRSTEAEPPGAPRPPAQLGVAGRDAAWEHG